MLQRAVVVVQAEQERTHASLPVLVPAETGDHAVGRSRVLDLEHGALARLVGQVRRLGDHAVETGALERFSHSAAVRSLAGHGCQVERRARTSAAGARGSGVPPAAPPSGRGRPAASRSNATNDAGVSSASIATRDAAGCSRICSASKSSPRGGRDHDLAVDHAPSGSRRAAPRAAPGSSGRAAARSRLWMKRPIAPGRQSRESRPTSARRGSRRAGKLSAASRASARSGDRSGRLGCGTTHHEKVGDTRRDVIRRLDPNAEATGASGTTKHRAMRLDCLADGGSSVAPSHGCRSRACRTTGGSCSC